MTEVPDPILHGLACLPRPTSRQVRADRVRARCHAVLVKRRQKRASAGRRAVLVFDAACLVALGIYLAGAVIEAVRLGGFL
jgi:hypothetical protein